METKKSEIVESVQIKQVAGTANDYTGLVLACKKAMQKLSADVEIKDMSDLVVRNIEEFMTIQALRDKKKQAKIEKTQKTLSGFAKIFNSKKK